MLTALQEKLLEHKEEKSSVTDSKGKGKSTKNPKKPEKGTDDEDQLNDILTQILGDIDKYVGYGVHMTDEIPIIKEKTNVLVCLGFFNQEVYDILSDQHIPYIDVNKEFSNASGEVMRELDPTKFYSASEKEIMVADNMYSKCQSKTIVMLKLTNQAFDAAHLIKKYKEAGASIIFINDSIDSLFASADKRREQKIYVPPDNWFFDPLHKYFKEDKTKGIVKINSGELESLLENWHSYFESKSDLAKRIESIPKSLSPIFPLNVCVN